MLVTRLVVNLVVSLVVGLVRWPRPFLVLADFKSQPGLFAHLAHLSKQCKNEHHLVDEKEDAYCKTDPSLPPPAPASPLGPAGMLLLTAQLAPAMPSTMTSMTIMPSTMALTL